MEISYENITPSLIPNTTMKKMLIDGVHKAYIITPDDGYVLHDKEADGVDEFEKTIHCYLGGACSCGSAYDFKAAQMTVSDVNGEMATVTAYGSREFFAFSENLVPEPTNNMYGEDVAFVEQIKAEERAVT